MFIYKYSMENVVLNAFSLVFSAEENKIFPWKVTVKENTFLECECNYV